MVGVEARNGAVELARIARPGKRQIKLADHSHCPLQLRQARRQPLGQAAKNLADLGGFVLPQADQLIVERNGCERLQEERVPGAALRVHHALGTRTRVGANRQHQPPAA